MSSGTLHNYTCSDVGLILPIINEFTWHIGLRAFLYILGMLWCFLGIAIVADLFMCGIETITSKTRVIKIPDSANKEGIREVEVKVWNDTVANLSLMAFGTSAPEIMLNVIEICGKTFVAGELGPGTIVGSAAFNLLVITAICIIAIPNGEFRRIENMRVYVTTTSFSMFAYFWLIVVLMFITPGQVDLWEAIVTFLGFPVLIVVAFAVDKKCWCSRKNKTSSEVEIGIDFSNVNSDEDGESTGEAQIIHMARELGKTKGLSEEDAAKLAASKLAEQQHHSSLWYRVNATRGLTGGHRLVPKVNDALRDLYKSTIEKQTIETDNELGSARSMSFVDLSDGGTKAVVEFTASSCAVLENEGKVRLGIRRSGCLKIPVTVGVETIDGTAVAGEDYKPLKEKVTFACGETIKGVHVGIVDDDVWEPDEIFFVKLTLEDETRNIVLGKASINQVTIINDDEPGKFEFSKPSYIVSEAGGKAIVQVNRINGADGTVSVSWETKDLTAVDGKDYIGGVGSLTFEHGETSKQFDFTVLDNGLVECEHNFQVELKSPTAGSEIGKIGKCIVTLVNDVEFEGLVSRIANMTMKNLDGLQLETGSYSGQIKDAMNVNGGDVDSASAVDYVMHFLTFFWKVLFALCVPPTSIAGGWLTFWCSLGMIGFLTAIVGDLATIFGCLIGLETTVTAITLVALGTSMPDTFASKAAAVNEKTADSSIGNINGSNAVNVFLGLGLPWLLATIYWEGFKGTKFVVPKGSVVFSVILYSITAVICTVILMLRRNFKVFGCAELGGPTTGKWVCAVIICLLWVLYVIMSSLNAYDIISVNL